MLFRSALPTDTRAAVPANAIYVWDSEYSPREGRTTLQGLHAQGWRDATTVTIDGVRMIVLTR